MTLLTIQDIQNQILPVPHSVVGLPGEALTRRDFHICLAAGTELTDYARGLLAPYVREGGLPLTLRLAAAPADISDPEEAYCLEITHQGVTITGYGSRGLTYGCLSLVQLLRRECPIAPCRITDWPDSSFRCYYQECRWGANMMEKADWFALVDDLAEKKLNKLCVALYGCWNVQYDGKVAEYLFLPLKEYPQLKTTFHIRYYSPTAGQWFDYEQVPPIYRDDLFGQIVRYGKSRGIEVFPSINSLGHNTLFPRLLPETSPKDDQGMPTNTGFCTSSPETYRLLFSIYDQLIDEVLIPNEVRSFSIVMDEVRAEYATDPDRPNTAPSPWCQCPQCQKKTKPEMYIGHAVKVIDYLKRKGMNTVVITNDMLLDHPKSLGYIADQFTQAVDTAGLRDVTMLACWYYYDTPYRLQFSDTHCDSGLRAICAPWNGYYNWSHLTNAMDNIALMAAMNRESPNCEGMWMYAAWDKSCDRLHDSFADHCWNHAGAGSPEDATRRHIARNFAANADRVCRAFRLMDRITEQRKEQKSDPDTRILANYEIINRHLNYYTYSYYSPKQPYPRHFPGEALGTVLSMRRDFERAMYSISSMAKEAWEIFRDSARIPGCNRELALRLAYECRNYRVLMEDWLAFLQIHDLQDKTRIAAIARQRQGDRLELMGQCEAVKEAFICKAAAMRNHSIFMQCFSDIAACAEDPQGQLPELSDITPIMSKENRMLR